MSTSTSLLSFLLLGTLLWAYSSAEHVEHEEFENPEQYFYKVDSVGSTRWKRDDGAVKLKKPIVKKPTQLDKTKATSNITKVAPTLNVTSKAVGSLLLGLNDSSDTSEYTAENLGSEMDEYNNSSVPVNKTREIDHHVYYNSTFFYHPEEAMSLWVDMDNKTSRSMPNVTLHTMLSNSYRRAATVNLSFPFPFYGYPMHNVTIATGGFLYLGHPVHSWLAATQYIAPLMSNFDTRADNSSTIKYADNGTAFVIQWENVMMKDKTPDGRFSFQAILKKNGDIVFVYRDIPVPLSQIPDITHPVKVGFSDAYVIDRTAFFIRKKTIYEYHRAELKSEAITNKTAIYFTALATCNLFHDCETCLSKTTDFDCKWCDKAKKCSDGLDRDRQLWIAMDCDTGPKDNKEQCPSLVVTPKNSPSQSVSGSSDQYKAGYKQGASFVNPPSSYRQGINGNPKSGSGKVGFVTTMIMISLISGVVLWILYAYKNPQSSSGQFLIKYRPAQWRLSGNEARYTAASIHM